MLINPHPPGNRGEEDIKVIVQMPLNLAYLSALTPKDEWEIDLIDEAIEPAIDEHGKLRFDADLVGITTLTYQAPRAYKIADAARAAGMKVVFGGAHTTTHPDEVALHADAIVKGEAEAVWNRFLTDYKNDTIEPIYDGGLSDLSVLNDLRPDMTCANCRETGGLRPHVVWFGEMPLRMDRILTALERCGLFISIGTSGNVYPAAGFVQEARRGGAQTVELNLERSEGATLFHEARYGPATDVVPAFVADLRAHIAQ